jgi:hypothetical protein
VPLSCNLGTLTSWNPLGHSRPVTGLLYPFFYVAHERVSSDNLVTNTLEWRTASRDQERVLGIQNGSVERLISDCSAVDNSDDSGRTGDVEEVRGTYGTREGWSRDRRNCWCVANRTLDCPVQTGKQTHRFFGRLLKILDCNYRIVFWSFRTWFWLVQNGPAAWKRKGASLCWKMHKHDRLSAAICEFKFRVSR